MRGGSFHLLPLAPAGSDKGPSGRGRCAVDNGPDPAIVSVLLVEN